MSISVPGTIVIQRKHGRKGDFNVGELITPIGEFEVKDAVIEQYEPGRYTGTFIITWIQPESFSWRGKVFVKNRAMVEDLMVDEPEERTSTSDDDVPPEPDPADTDAQTPRAVEQRGDSDDKKSPKPARVSRGSAGSAASTSTSPDSADADVPDTQLFGDELFAMVEQGEPVKLDPTVDRMQFRAQRDRLKELGFRFDAKTQTWLKQPTVH